MLRPTLAWAYSTATGLRRMVSCCSICLQGPASVCPSTLRANAQLPEGRGRVLAVTLGGYHF